MSIRDHLENRNRGFVTRRRHLTNLVGMVTLVSTLAMIGVSEPSAASGGAGFGLHQASRSEIRVQVEPDAGVTFSRQCAGCHGAGGEGDVGPDLRTWSGSTEEAGVVVGEGADGMPSFAATLTQDQIDGLAVYVDELVGVSVYGEQCARCHGDSGEGSVGPSLKMGNLDDVSRRFLIVNGLDGMPGFSATLTDDQIDALVRRSAGYADVGPIIFAGQCAACHGAQGQGLTGPALASSTITDAFAIVESGFGGMPAFGPTLDPGDIEAVIQYAFNLDSTPVEAPSTTTVPTTVPTTTTLPTTIAPALGAEAYAERCAFCHGADAEGGTGPSLVGTVLAAEALALTIDAGQGSMPGLAGTISPEEVAEIVAFVQALAEPSSVEPTEHGADVYVTQCAACHGGDGRGSIGPSLRTTQLVGDALRDAIASGNATMPAFSRTLTAEDLELVTVYVEGLGARRELGGPRTDFAGGAALYRQDCFACHGEGGEGGIGGDLRGSSLTTNEIVTRVYGGHAAGMPAFEGALDGREVLGVAGYVKTFQVPGGATPGLADSFIVAIAAGLFLVVGYALVVVRKRRLEG